VSLDIRWSVFAIGDRSAIFDFIEADSQSAAIAVDLRVMKRIDRLRRFPESGRPGRVEGTREVVILRTPYIVAYRIVGVSIVILSHSPRSAAMARQFVSKVAKHIRRNLHAFAGSAARSNSGPASSTAPSEASS
jgi:toxin ParE1/3/4